MYKNQLQELAQRSCFNLPAYACIREGPDHAPRFKATVNFNGEIFESPSYCATLRQAEHAAAEVALNVLSKRGPSQSLAARVLDETGVCKNLLQETAQRVGVSLPVYTTIKGGPGHVPVFSCIVEVGGRVFAGEPAKTKKQAEKNAAMAAWSVVKQLTQSPLITDCEESTADELDRGNSMGGLTLYKRENRAQQMQSSSRFYGGRSRVRMVNVRERNRLSREGSPAGQFQDRRASPASSPTGERSYESQRFLFNQQPGARSSDLGRSGATHQRSHSLSGIDASMLPQQEAVILSRGSLASGGYLGRAPLPGQHPQRLSRLSLQSCSDRFELRRPFMEELQLLEREGDNDWLGALDSNTSIHLQPQLHQQMRPGNILEGGNPRLQNKRALFQSQSERFELKPSLLDELYQRDEEEWCFRGEMMQQERNRAAIYEGRDKGTYMFYDENKGSFTNTEDISYSSSYNNDPGNIGSSYGSGYRDVVGTPYGGSYGTNVAKKGSFTGYGEGLDLPSSYTGFNTAAQMVSYAGDKGSSYSSFNVDIGEASFFNKDVSKSAFSGYSKNVSSRSNVNENKEGASSSTSVWSHPEQWWTAHLPASPSTTSSAVAQSLDLRPPSSIAPPVRVRQMVAVCSAPPPRSMAVDNTATNMGTHALQCGPPPLDRTSSIDADTSTSELFNQLRL